MLTNYSKNLMLDHLVDGVSLYCSAHTDVPSAAGSNEYTASRVPITFNAAVEGDLVGSADSDINILAGNTITHVGLFDAATGGNFIAGFELPTAETFSNDGGLRVNGLTISLN